jgi:hypothetical protein
MFDMALPDKPYKEKRKKGDIVLVYNPQTNEFEKKTIENEEEIEIVVTPFIKTFFP